MPTFARRSGGRNGGPIHRREEKHAEVIAANVTDNLYHGIRPCLWVTFLLDWNDNILGEKVRFQGFADKFPRPCRSLIGYTLRMPAPMS
jgi:hypothetical protein